MKLPRLQLYTKILIALALGAAFGLLASRLHFSGFVLAYVKPFGTAFVRLISMVVVPLVFASLLVGTASLKDIRSLGRIGVRTLVFYLCTTAVAITIGLLVANVWRPGAGLSEEAKSELLTGVAKGPGGPMPEERPSIRDVLLNVIPTNPIRAFAEGQMLQIIFFALLTGICLTLVPPPRAGPVIRFFESVNDVVIQMVHLIMKLAPFGVFALIASVVADFGLDILLLLIKYCLAVAAGLLLHVLLVYSSAVRAFSRLAVRRFFAGIRPAQLIAFSSGSSSATLPVTIECTSETLGVSRYISSFTLPLGATINMDGTALYQGVSAVFLAQLYGLDLGLGQQLTVVLTATLASIGTAGTPGAGIVTLAVVLTSIGVPLEGIAIIMGVERILDMCRSVVNITGDAACAVVVGATERQLELGPADESGERKAAAVTRRRT
jgi:Na+/H+-dicarboxylate symporter